MTDTQHYRPSDHRHTWTRVDVGTNVLGVWECPCGASKMLWVPDQPVAGQYRYLS